MLDAPLNSLGFAKAPADTRVVVAMSGGVDSSVVAAQLAEGGRVAMVQSRPGAVQHAVLGTRLHGKIFMSPVMDATAPSLPGFAPAPSFVF